MNCPKCGGEMETKVTSGWKPAAPSFATMLIRYGVLVAECKSCGYIELYRKK